MAKHVILEAYSFTPSTRTIVVTGKWIRREQLLLITNVTKGTVIYNFSDPSLGASSYSTSFNQYGNELTTIVVSYDTTSHSATDKISILVEETYESFSPAETFMDPVGKLRTSTPQSLIDTDFEYGQQPTKWESISVINNRPTCFYDTSSVGQQFMYNNGIITPAVTASTTIVGSGTNWTQAMIGSRFIAADGTDCGLITAVASATSLTVERAVSIAAGTGYAIYGFPYKGAGVPSTVTDPTILYQDLTNDATGYTIGALINTGTTNISVGQPIFIQNSLDASNVDGWWIVDSVVTNTTVAAGAGAQDIVRFRTQAVTNVTNATFTAGISGTTLTVGTLSTGTIQVGQMITVGATAGTRILSGSGSTWTVSISQTVSGGTSMTATGALFDPTKTLIMPGAFYTGAAIPVSSIAYATTTVTVTTSNAHGLNVGQHVHIHNTTGGSATANGTYAITSTPTNNTFTYTVPATLGTSGTLTLNGGTMGTLFPRAQGYVIHRPFDGGVQFANQTAFHGQQMTRQTRRYFRYQSGKGIQFSTGSILKPALAVDSITSASTTATVTTKYPHGLTFSSVGTNAQVKISGAIDVAGMTFAGTASQSGTVVTIVGGYIPNTVVGQTFMFADGTSAGTISAWSSATTLSVSTSQTVAAQKYYIQSTAYNGTFTLASVPTPYTFTYTMATTPTQSTTVAYPIQQYPDQMNVLRSQGLSASVVSWYGGKNRVGLFDQQNGFFFEFDGQQLYAVRRSSTFQVPFTFTVSNGSPLVTSSGGTIANYLKPGDWIVIRGQTYTVQTITSATQMYIYPEYRGATVNDTSNNIFPLNGVIISKTIDTRIPQSQWNIDKCDGTGHSGYNVDLSNMQMFYIDYSWYGAGAIRWGFKNARGEIIYCHRMANNNVNTEAYMRSGNISARYETTTQSPTTFVTQSWPIASTTGTLYVADASQFPPAGTILVTGASAQTGQNIEYMTYTARDNTSFTISARGVAGGAAASTFTFSNIAPLKVELYLPSVASTISHWGSSVIMDGRYDDDKSLVFAAGMNTVLNAGTTKAPYPLISIRCAPSVDSGVVAPMGSRDIINRMQLILRQMDAFTTQSTSGAWQVDLWLNAAVASGYYYGATGTTANSTTLNLTGTLVGVAPTAGSYIFGPSILPGTFFKAYTNTTTNTMTQAASATRGGTYYFSNMQFYAVGGSSLAQRYIHASTDRLVPGTGERIFTFFTNSTGVTQQDLSAVRDLATSIIGGSPTNYVSPSPQNKYPDGPDVITMVATPVGTINTATIIARLSWTEAQA